VDPEPIALVALFFGVPALVTVTALWLGARSRAKRAEAIIHQLTVAPALRGERGRPDGLGTAVDAIAVEVERIAEGQRFLIGVLSKDVSRALPPEPPYRAITPH